jgi:TolB protein
VNKISSQRFPTWAAWLIGAVTLLAAALLIFAAILGVQAGQRQLEFQRRQQIGIALQQAYDARSEGKRDVALDAYKHVIELDPTNALAREGIETLLKEIATAGKPNTSPTIAPSAASPTATLIAKQPVATDATTLFKAAQTVFSAGRWQETVNQLLALKQLDSTYQPDQVESMLFDSYLNLATERDNDNNLEEALTLFDKALALRPNNVQIQNERDLIAKYLDAINAYGADAITALQTLYTQEPDYRDVADRLYQALVDDGDALVTQSDWCAATKQFTAALAVKTTTGLTDKARDSQQRCSDNGASSTNASQTPTAGTAVATRPGEAKGTATAESTPTATAPLAAPPNNVEPLGRLIYSARDLTSGHNHIYSQAVGSSLAPVVLRDDAAQPALRGDGQRLAFRNVRTDMSGLSAFDLGGDVFVRFTEYAEDSLPSWSPQGNKLVFASTREGDRLWRIYITWADANAQQTPLLFGESPKWHPTLDQIVYRGCDPSGNNCGLRTMTSSGTNQTPLTNVQADNRPSWSLNGRYVVFMSDGRDGNMEIYRVEVSSGQILRLTDNAAVDVLPVVSPDDKSVAFFSNRDGGWKIWSVPIGGGTATLLSQISSDLGNWSEQGLEWVP